MLPMPRRDVEQLHQILALQPRLLDLRAPLRAQRALLHRQSFNDALTWLEIHGDRPEVVAHWRALQSEPQTAERSRRPAYATLARDAAGGDAGGFPRYRSQE